MLTLQAREVRAGFSLLEGPRWLNDSLFVSDFFAHTVWRIGVDRGGDVTSIEAYATVAGQPSGLGLLDGRVMSVSMVDRRVLRLPEAEVYADLSSLLPSEANDMCVASNGDMYVTTFGTAGIGSTELHEAPLVHIPKDGGPSVAAEGLIFPNGIALSSDERTLFVAETYAARITAFDRDERGSLSRRRVFVSLDDSAIPATATAGDVRLACLPDGLAVDRSGRLWMADAKGPAVQCFSAAGDRLLSVSTAPYSSYAVAIGGHDGQQLFVCCAPANGTFDPRATRHSVLMVADLKGAPEQC